MQKVEQIARLQLGGAIAQRFGPGSVQAAKAAVQADDAQQVRGEGEEPVQLVGLFPQGLLDPLALGDVLVGPQHADHLARVIAQRALAGPQPDAAAIGGCLGFLVIHLGDAAGHDLAVVGPVKLRLVPPAQVEVAPADDRLGRGQTGINGAQPVASQVDRVPVLPEHPYRNGIQHELEHSSGHFRFRQLGGPPTGRPGRALRRAGSGRCVTFGHGPVLRERSKRHRRLRPPFTVRSAAAVNHRLNARTTASIIRNRRTPGQKNRRRAPRKNIAVASHWVYSQKKPKALYSRCRCPSITPRRAGIPASRSMMSKAWSSTICRRK